MEEINKNYFSVIPAKVRYDKTLNAAEKLLYAEVTCLCYEKGYCFASNKHFSEILGVVTETVSRQITKLINKGYLRREITYKKGTKQIEQRRLYPLMDMSTPIDENVNTPIDENVKDSNTSNSIHNSNKEEIYKEEKKNSKSDYEFDFEKYAIDDLEEFGKVIQDWISYKTERHNTYTKTGFKTFVKKLIEYSNGEYEKAQEIVDTSIANNYLGIFPLKRRM